MENPNVRVNREPSIIKASEAISVKKSNGTEVDYLLFDSFEIHTNIIPSGCIQDWHSHERIEEILILTKGSLLLEWLDNGLQTRKVSSGETIRMNNSIHRLSNESELVSEFTILRFVSSQENQSELIKNDKQSYSEEEIAALKTRDV